MNYLDIAFIFLVLIFTAIIAYSIYKKHVKWIIGSSLSFVILIGLILFSLFSYEDNGFNYREIKDYTPDKSIIIQNNQLTYNDDTPITLIDDRNRVSKIKYYPIYINELDSYYLLVFSKDKDRTLSNSLYLQQDYEMYRDKVDILTLISKQDGKVHTPRVYELIGSIINLNESRNVADSIILPVYKPFQENVNYFYLIQAIPTQNRLHFKTDIISLSMNRNIDKFVFLENIFLTLFDTGEVVYEIQTNVIINETKNSSSFSYSSKYSNILDDEAYVKQGYFTTHNNQLYIIGNDFAIYLVEGESLTLIKNLTSLDTWLEEINVL